MRQGNAGTKWEREYVEYQSRPADGAPAWSHVVELVNDSRTPKPLLLAAISAVGSIRPAEAGNILVDLANSEDEEIAEAADEAMAEAEVASDEEDNEEDEWIN
jgi:hypothetical protein